MLCFLPSEVKSIGQERWSDDAIDYFSILVANRDLVSKIKDVCADGRLSLTLIDTSNDDVDIMIGAELVANGLAEEIAPSSTP